MISTIEKTSTVLLVDDEEPLLDVLGTALEDAGYDCVRASNAVAALKLLDRTPEMDLIVSDIRMPGMDGIELLGVAP
ncbi:response regulator receiver domain-containing protein [Ochrobactrum sp. BH3]|nr:response regulator receiver domain-containing protein [Ochrobactrum sp. BH3]